MPTAVTKSLAVGGLPPQGTLKQLTQTLTSYCDSIAEDSDGNHVCASGDYPPETTLFVYPMRVTDRVFLHVGELTGNARPEAIVTDTDFRFDGDGNSIRTTATVEHDTTLCSFGDDCPMFHKTTVNDYSAATAAERRFGKVKLTTVTSQQTLPFGPPIVHKTKFSYNPSPGGVPFLVIKDVEPDRDVPLRTLTHYFNDDFGNLAATTDCASDFINCNGFEAQVNAHDPARPRYRRSTASYDPAQFTPPGNAPIGNLTYAPGRFPVKRTNPEGHVTYVAYDSIKGVPILTTDENGVSTCYTYDSFGRKTSETVGCGSERPLRTTVNQYRPVPGDPPTARVVTVLRPPTGADVFTYADTAAHTVLVRTRSFDGGIAETTNAYDRWGRLLQQSNPHVVGREDELLTHMLYDEIGRIRSVTTDLGQIDDSGTPKLGVANTHYDGTTITTDHRVNGQDQQQPRIERKNMHGKLASLTDANGSTISYKYDADGNLTDTFEPSNNLHIEYDVRGRKITSSDADLGSWRFEYNGFGDVIRQFDSKNEQVTMFYDRLGRMTSRSDASDRTAEWVYDKAPGAGIGKLAAMVSPPDDRLRGPCAAPYGMASDGNRGVRSLTYTNFGEIQDSSECADGDTFVTSYGYDNLGRQAAVTYPQAGDSRFGVEYHYTGLGFLHYVSDAADKSVYWAATAMDGRNQITGEYTKNGVETTLVRNPATGWLMGSYSKAHLDHETVIQNWGFRYDEVGNLRARVRADDVSGPISEESFTYDALNRVETSRVLTAAGYDRTDPFHYDYRGNLTEKDGKRYTYSGCGAGPHAVCTVGDGPAFVYDENGSMTSGAGRHVDYDAFHKPTHIDNGTNAA
ncbi:MAG TPA: hypothetical protein VN903_18400, partial [Polyangia bacterium]|nr:hypothetical protein [Polyangia bacterium]